MSKPKVLTVSCLLALAMILVLPDQVYASGPHMMTLPSGEQLHDPTKPVGWSPRKAKKVKARAKQYKLNYILNSEGRKQAIVNGQKVTEGEMVAGAKVISIGSGTVTLSVDGQKRVLSLGKTNTGIKRKQS